MTIQIAPSILSADFARLADEVDDVVKAGADLIHVDVMDGHFVPNITMGPIVVEALRRQSAIPLDVHLMIESPERYLDIFCTSGATSVSVHAEATPHLYRALQTIRNHGIRAGVAVNPATSFQVVEDVLPELDFLLVMTVNPGFAGQSFLPSMLRKIERARKWLNDLGRPDIVIEVDGGINESTAVEVVAAGADILVAGSAIFAAVDRKTALQALRNAAENGSSN